MVMNLETIMFYLLSTLTVVASLRVITARNPVHAALSLVLAFFCMAGIWLLMEAEFLALTLVLVYVGAVMVLFLFVVMMIDIDIEKLRAGFWRFLPFAALVGIVLLVEMVMVLGNGTAGNVAQPVAHAAGYSNTKELGRLIYTNYVFVFELAAVLLVVAIVAAIALTLRQRHGTKHQEQSEQMQVRRNDRVKLVSVPSASSAEAVKK